MLVNLNPSYTSKKKLNSPNFKALNIKTTKEAEMYLMDISKGKIKKTPENIQDLVKMIQVATQNGNKFVALMLEKGAKRLGFIE